MKIDRLFVTAIAVFISIAAGTPAVTEAGDSSDESRALSNANGSSPSTDSAHVGPIVTVTGGRIGGAPLRQGGVVFEGIPYAQPPVGDLRWREPMPVLPWSGVRDATKFGAICPQGTFNFANAAQISKEDCLYLNVWTPEWPSKTAKAVMVWIPGGGNFAGGIVAGGREGIGESLVRRGVVVVSLNYRLGSFGFFSHPALTRESPHHASGNQGLLDQIAALKWVRANISKFGGDPHNITVFGESAGSFDASVLMTTPLSKGLFARVIAESGSVGTPKYFSVADAERCGAKLAERWNLPPGASLTDLRAVSMADILKSDPNYMAEGTDCFPPIVIDGHFLSASPLEVFAHGGEHRVALLHGNNSWDFVGWTQRELGALMRDAYGPLAERATKLYAVQNDATYGTPKMQWFSDTTFRCPAVAQLLWHANAGNDSYEYEFTHVPPGAKAPGAFDAQFAAVLGTSDVGAFHSSEVPYVFGGLANGIEMLFETKPIAATSVDYQVSATLQEYWTNFAKTGDPNGDRLPKWPKFDASRRSYIDFTTDGPVAKEGLRRAQCDLFIENVTRLMANAKNESERN